MIIQAAIPRPRFDILECPEYVYIHTLAKARVSSGTVLFNGVVNPEHGIRESRQLDPHNVYEIQGEPGFEGYEYVLPFFELYQHTKIVRKGLLEETGASGYGNIGLVPFTTGGFNVSIRSAFRASPTHYEERIIAFTILMPVTGGGILRLADSPFDISNPTFNPYALKPRAIRSIDTERMLNQAHAPRSDSIEKRRIARVEAAEQAMVAATQALPAQAPLQLPQGSTLRTKS